MIAPSDLAIACIEYGMTLSDEERAGFRALADRAPPAGSTLAGLRSADEAIGQAWCGASCPEEPSWVCSRPLGHGGRHESREGGDWYDEETA